MNKTIGNIIDIKDISDMEFIEITIDEKSNFIHEIKKMTKEEYDDFLALNDGLSLNE